MSLVERLEKLAKELDQQRWRNGMYDSDKAEQSDLILDAAKVINSVELAERRRKLCMSAQSDLSAFPV